MNLAGTMPLRGERLRPAGLFSPARRKLQNPHFQPPEWWVKEVNECVRQAAGHRRPAAFAPHFAAIRKNIQSKL